MQYWKWSHNCATVSEGKTMADSGGREGCSGRREVKKSGGYDSASGLDKLGASHGPESNMYGSLAGRATMYYSPDSGIVQHLA